MPLAMVRLTILMTLAMYVSAQAPTNRQRMTSDEKKDKEAKDEVDKKFDDLGRATKNVTYRWKYPHRFPKNSSSNTTNGNHNGTLKKVSFCGKRIPMKFRHLWNVKPSGPILGRQEERSFHLWKNTRARSFLSVDEHPGRESYAVPGAGGDQKLAEGGAAGQVAGEEPFATVLKDGYWGVGCFNDVMVTAADKYGNEKDKYKDQAGVSVALYDELLDDADKKAMTPEVCFEFCSTLPDMVFFGITEGRKCYCTPYFKPGAGASGDCTAVCAGDTTQMCGSTAGKSSIFEMHLCDE